MSKVIVYGIPNCDTVKKVLQWLKNHEIEVTFYNYKKTPVTEDKLKQWCSMVDWKILFNTKGTTWKKIAPQFEGKTLSQQMAIKIMLENNSIIKRPVVEIKKSLLVGFDEAAFAKTFSKK